jgi:hypothetical protein
MNHPNYFTFDILPYTEVQTFESFNKETYYIYDMRISDSICFFCGKKVVRREFDPLALDPYAHPVTSDTITTGFIARFNLKRLMQDSASWVTLSPSGLSVQITTWYPDIQIATIEQTASLEKLWVEDGLHTEGNKNPEGEDDDPLYVDNAVYYDPSFSIENARAYLIGRLTGKPDSTCLVIVHDMLQFSSFPSNYSVLTPENENEKLCDVKGTDGRIIISSRIFDDIHREVFPIEYILGVRYRDNVTGDDDFLSHLHLYAYYTYPSNTSWVSNPLPWDEYGHICRLKNYCAYNSCEETMRIDDFCLVYTCTNYENQFSETSSITHIIHINKDMDVDMAFHIGERTGYGGKYPISDVVFLGGYDRNRIAISYMPSFNKQYIDLVDWGYAGREALSSPLFDKSLRLFYPDNIPNSLDVFMNGTAFLSGNTDNTNNAYRLFTQHRGWIDGESTNVTCTNASKIVNIHQLEVSHLALDWGMVLRCDTYTNWFPVSATAVKQDIDNKCKKTIER